MATVKGTRKDVVLGHGQRLVQTAVRRCGTGCDCGGSLSSISVDLRMRINKRSYDQTQNHNLWKRKFQLQQLWSQKQSKKLKDFYIAEFIMGLLNMEVSVGDFDFGLFNMWNSR